MDELAAAPRPAAERGRGQGVDRRGLRLRLARLAPVLAAALAAAAWLIAEPRTADLAAHSYRAWLFDHEGFALWNAQWYGGHHVPGYSVLFPPLAAVLGAPAAVALAGLASAAALVALARACAPDRPAVAWLATSGAVANLVVGRGPFALGLAFGALALVFACRERAGRAAAAGVACALSSPVAGLFLAVVAAGWWAAARPSRAVAAARWWAAARPSRALVAAGAVPVAAVLALVIAFPEGGHERFPATAFWPMLTVSAVALWLVAPERRAIRLAGVLYLAVLVAAFAVENPVGQNAARLGVLAGPAVLAAAAAASRPRALVWVVGTALLYLHWLPAVRAVAEAGGDPATPAAYHRPLTEFLARASAPGDRVEIPATRNHWEAAEVAPSFALARGWERQLDTAVNALFYDGALTPARYEAWLRREAIRWVALPDAPLDSSARAEAALLRRGGLAFLRPAFRSAHWTVWELRDAPPPVTGPARLAAAGPQRIELAVDRPGDLVVRRRYTRYWRVTAGRACVTRAPAGWTGIRADAPGRIVLEARLVGGQEGCGEGVTGH